MAITFKVKTTPAPAPAADTPPAPAPVVEAVQEAPQDAQAVVAANPLPWEDNPATGAPGEAEEGMFAALGKFSAGAKGVLMLVHKNNGNSLQVLHYDPETKRIRLRDNNKMVVTPVIGEREAALYSPFWR